MKAKTKEDTEGRILALGWDTESTSSGRFRALRGGLVTEWRSCWREVMWDVLAQGKEGLS